MDTSYYRYFLGAYLLPEWRRVVMVCGLMASTIALQIAGPQILRAFIDLAGAHGSLAMLTRDALLFLAVALAAQFLAVAETYVAENLGWLATNRLRAALMLHCLHLDPSFHQNHSPGALIERIDGDATTLGNFFSRFVVYVLGNGLLLLGIIVMLFRVDWRVGGAVLLFTMISLLTMNRLRSVAVPHWAASRQASAALMGFIEEHLAGMEDIRSSGATAYVMRRLYERSRDLLRLTRRASTVASSLGATLTLLFAMGTALALGVAAYLFSAGLITLGTVFLIFSYSQMLENPIDEITRQLQDFQQAAAGMARIHDLLRTRASIVDGPHTSLPSGPLSVAFDGVTFGYDPAEPVLQEVSFQIEPGRVLGILGRTGSGKTTISRLIFRLYDPDGGTVRLGGIDPRTETLHSLRSHVGMVSQEIQLFHASVRDNLTFFDRSVPDDLILSTVYDLGLGHWYESLPHGLDTELTGGARGLSAGEGQLLAFARVFVQDPGLVILDEASSRLDPATEMRIERAVDRLLQGRTAIIIAHRLGTVQRADDILVLDRGRVVEYGSRERLANDPSTHFSGLLRRGLETPA